VRFIKLGLISIIFFFLLATIISLFIPSHVTVSRAVEMNAAVSTLHDEIAHPLNWPGWFPGMDSTLPFSEGNQVTGRTLDSKKGRHLIVKNQTDSSVTAEYVGASSKKVISVWNLHPGMNKTVTVQWTMNFSLQWYPWEKFASLLFDKQYGGQMETGLNRLKSKVEQH
jgi:hypothetical protein